MEMYPTVVCTNRDLSDFKSLGLGFIIAYGGGGGGWWGILFTR